MILFYKVCKSIQLINAETYYPGSISWNECRPPYFALSKLSSHKHVTVLNTIDLVAFWPRSTEVLRNTYIFLINFHLLPT